MRKKLIKWLGGYTKEELAEFGVKSIRVGVYDTLNSIQAYMRDINGECAESWCDLVWKDVCKRLEYIRAKVEFITK